MANTLHSALEANEKDHNAARHQREEAKEGEPELNMGSVKVQLHGGLRTGLADATVAHMLGFHRDLVSVSCQDVLVDTRMDCNHTAALVGPHRPIWTTFSLLFLCNTSFYSPLDKMTCSRRWE